MKTFYKRFALLLSIVVIASAILTSLVRELTPWVSQYKADIEAYMSKSLGVPVTIGEMETGWYWLNPVIKFNQVKIKGQSDHSIKLHQFFLGINPLSSVWNWRIEPGILYVDNLKLDLMQVDGRWHFVGIPVSWQLPSMNSANPKNPSTAWITSEPLLALRDIAVTLHFENGQTVAVQHLNVYTAKRWGRYRIKGSAWVKKTKPVYLELAANLPEGNVDGIHSIDGELYLAVNGMTISDWQAYLPKFPFALSEGRLNMQAWINLAAGEVTRVQTAMKLRDLKVRRTLTASSSSVSGNMAPGMRASSGRAKGDRKGQQTIIKNITFNQLDGNILWDKKKNGYSLSGDHIALTLNGQAWPENQFQLIYDNRLNEYQFYAQTVVIDSILSSAAFLTSSAMNLKTEVDKVSSQSDQDSIFTQPLSMLKAQTQRKVEGTLHDFQIHIKNAVPVMFLSRFTSLGWQGDDKIPGMQGLSGALSWQPQGGRLALDAKDSLMQVPNQKSVTWEDINGVLNWQQTQHGLRFALTDFLLKQADMVLKGRAAFNPELMMDAGGQLDVSVQWSAVNAQQWLVFVPKNVLKKKLERWLRQDIKRIDTLDGQFELHGALQHFPYDKTPGTFFIRAQFAGTDLFFAPNWPLVRDIQATLTQNARNMTVNIHQADLSGTLVKAARLWIDDIGLNHEIMHVHTDVHAPLQAAKDYMLHSPLQKRFDFLTLIDVQGDIGMALDLQAPLYPEDDEVKAQGTVNFQDNVLTLHHRLNKIDFQHVRGPLHFQDTGVQPSDLSAVFLRDPVSISLDVVRNPKLATRIRMKGTTTAGSLSKWLSPNLLKLLTGALNWEASVLVPTTSHDFDSIHFQSDLKGLRIDLPDPFGKSLEAVKPLQVNISLKNPQLVEYVIDYAKILQLTIQNNQSEWIFKIRQAMIDAQVMYDPKIHQLKGQILRLTLPEQLNKKSSRSTLLSSVKPQDLPSVDLNIEDFEYGKLKLGRMSIKGAYQSPAWVLQDLQISATGYQGRMSGRWIKQGKKQETVLNGQLNLENLAKNMAIWDLTQALDAQRAALVFQAKWPDDMLNVSLNKLYAECRLVLRDGVISHLSKETEQKLGLGKLLSILSLQTIPRRLTLDFSDLANKGYTFDVFEGNFVFNQGIVITENSYMDGPVAYASMKGTIDTNKRLYDLNFKIAPHITASLPIVATIAGGPIAGVATWVASKIINQMQRITAYTYKLSGSWDEPVVEPMRLYKAKS